MASMKDVAKLAEVSVSTVSRVISGNIKVEEVTKKRVEEAIRQVNYRPNLAAQGLRIKSAKMIGLIVPEINHPAFVNFINSTEKYAAEKSLNLIVCNTSNDPEKAAAAFDQLLRRNINGIIISRVSDESQAMELISGTDIPVIVMDRTLNRENVPSILLDNYKAGQLAAQHLIKSGRKKIACITGNQKILLVRERLLGFYDMLNRHGIVLEEKNIIEGSFTFEAGRNAAEFLLGNKADIDGIWAQSDLEAQGVITTYLRAGIKIPDDIAVLGMDDIMLSAMTYPSITTISQPYDEMGRTAVELIDAAARGEKPDKKEFKFEPELIIRESAP